MTVAAEIMSTDFVFVESDATVAEAEEYLEEYNLDALPVLNPDRTVFGLLTQKNLAQFYRRPLNNPRAFHAWEICDARPLAATAHAAVADVADALVENGGSHVLVVDDERRLVGVITTEILLKQEIPVHANLHDDPAPLHLRRN